MRSLEEIYIVPDSCKRVVLKKANEIWRNYKSQLRKECLDPFPTVAERRAHCPSGIRQEDWERFVEAESTPESSSRRQKVKALRKNMKTPHTSGRRGSARTLEKLRADDPIKPVTRTDVYLATHTRRDGTYPTQELGVQLEQIRAIVSSDPSSTSRDVDHDPVAEVLGPEHRGRVRAMGVGVSRRTLTDSTPARDRLRQEQASRLSLQEQIDNMQQQMDRRMDEMQRQWAARSSHDSASGSSETSRRRSSLPTQSSQVEQMCDVLHPGCRVLGVGRVVTCDDGSSAPDGFRKIILDTATDPDAYLLCPESTSDLLGDVVGAPMFWPTCFIRLR